MTQQSQTQIDQLLLQLIDGVISDEGFGVLRRWFEHDDAAAEYYSLFMSDYAACKMEISSRISRIKPSMESDALDRELWDALAETEKTAPTIHTQRRAIKPRPTIVEKQIVEIQPRKVNKSLLVTTISSLAAFLILAAYVYLNPRTSPPIVGVLTQALDARWTGPGRGMVVGDDLRAGPVHLREGIAEIRLDSGASVILEGPAEIELQSVNSLFLHRGRLVATVGREAVGFVVNTVQGKVLDLGTEFAVHVGSNDHSEIHVFQGEVMFYPDSEVTHRAVTAGHAYSVSIQGEIEAISARPRSFVRTRELTSRVLARQGHDYHRWRASIYELHRDPSLRAHYFYNQSATQSSNAVLNAAPLTEGALNGLVAPDDRNPVTWVQGRWPQKSGVRFERGKQQAILIAPDPALAINGPITISTWVYFPNETQMGGHLISCRRDNHINYQFSMFDDTYSMVNQRNRFEFLRYGAQDRNWCHSQRFELQPGQWYHFAMTHDNERISFYVNGQRHERKEYRTRVEPIAGEILLGSMKQRNEYLLPDGDFDGVVDELMIFDRCLSDDEIEAIHEAGRPAST